MSDDKDRGKQSQDTSEDVFLYLQVLHHSHRKATRLLLMTAREGVTDSQITHVVRQGLPQDPDDTETTEEDIY
jgi:hypothetical protein